MRVAHLSLGNFRNYRTAELALCPGPNLLIGRNGQGKTNLVEAIAYFATLRSHRVTGDDALIRAGEESAVMRMRVEASSRSVSLEMQLNRGRANRAQVNRNPVRARELPRWFSTIVFAPEDLTIVRGDPGGRRRFLDEALIARSPAAAGVIADYERVVRQRTSLLKNARASGGRMDLDATLGIWDEQLVEHGSRIMLARRELLADLKSPLRAGYFSLVGEDHSPTLDMGESVTEMLSRDRVSRETDGVLTEVAGDRERAHVSRETIRDQFLEALAVVRQQELERAVTLVGPHRDDLLLGLNSLPVKGYASHGESWSFALSLRLSLAQILREDSPGGDPVIILDDVFAELDTARRTSLMSAVMDFEQVIVTAAVEKDVPSDLEWQRVRIEAGAIVDDGGEGGGNGSDETRTLAPGQDERPRGGDEQPGFPETDPAENKNKNKSENESGGEGR